MMIVPVPVSRPARWQARAGARAARVTPVARAWASLRAALGPGLGPGLGPVLGPVLGVLLAAGLAAGQDDATYQPPADAPATAADTSAAEPVVVDVAAGEAALRAASQAKGRAYDLEGEARTAALLDVARQYGVVADTRRFGVDARAEAAFRAGELLRARKRAAEAGERFAQATALGEPAEPDSEARAFAARALLEQAHALRRADDAEGALQLYGQVRARFPEQQKTGAYARGWTVKLLVRGGQLDAARPHVAEFNTAHPERPVEAVRAAEELAEALVEAGRAEEARQLATAVEAQVVPVGSDEPVTERLASALEALRVTVSPSGY